MVGFLRSAKATFALLILSLLTLRTLAQETTAVDVNVDGDADSGIITGSPWLWLIFVVVIIIVIVTLTSRRKNS